MTHLDFTCANVLMRYYKKNQTTFPFNVAKSTEKPKKQSEEKPTLPVGMLEEKPTLPAEMLEEKPDEQ